MTAPGPSPGPALARIVSRLEKTHHSIGCSARVAWLLPQLAGLDNALPVDVWLEPQPGALIQPYSMPRADWRTGESPGTAPYTDTVHAPRRLADRREPRHAPDPGAAHVRSRLGEVGEPGTVARPRTATGSATHRVLASAVYERDEPHEARSRARKTSLEEDGAWPP